MKKATVVIPNYNGIKYVVDCLNSLQALKEQELFEILVVDNGSQDGSLKLIREKFPQVQTVVLLENTGFCHAVNVGIGKSETPFVILLNNDTVVLPGFVEALVGAIEKEERIFAVSSCMLQWQDHGKIDDAGDQYCVLGWAYARGKGAPAASYNKAAFVFSACGGASIYRKSILEEIGLFDEEHFAYLEDMDISYRAAIYGYRCYYEPKARVLHAGSATSGSRYNAFKTRLSSANNVYLICKNMPLLQLLWNLPFLLIGFFVKTIFFFCKGMGILYIKGLIRGLCKALSAEGRCHKVPFRWKYLGNYIRIQMALYGNLIRYPFKR